MTGATSGQASVMTPWITTVSASRPQTTLEIPIPRYLQISWMAVRAAGSPLVARWQIMRTRAATLPDPANDLLIEVPNAPAGLGPGARVPVILSSGVRSGYLLPRDAVLYDENGPYVFKKSERKTQKTDGKTSFVPVKVKLLAAAGGDWLTEGLDDDDAVVVQGAGVLWSLQGMAGQAPDDDDD